MAVRTVNDVKLNVKPIFFCMEHKYYYEGPCRMASGQALEPGFDAMVNGKIYDGFEKAIRHREVHGRLGHQGGVVRRDARRR